MPSGPRCILDVPEQSEHAIVPCEAKRLRAVALIEKSRADAIVQSAVVARKAKQGELRAAAVAQSRLESDTQAWSVERVKEVVDVWGSMSSAAHALSMSRSH